MGLPLACNSQQRVGTDVFRVGDMMTSSFEGLSRSNITQQSSKGSLFTNFEDVEVIRSYRCIV